MGGRRGERGRREKSGRRKERGEKLRKIWREREKEENIAHTNLTPRRETRGGRGGGLPPPPLVHPIRLGVSFPFISQ